MNSGGGGERFSDFMARALYDAQRGYYTRRIRDVGGGAGDFATRATLSPRLGRGIASWLCAELRQHPAVRHVIEVGAGNGALMGEVQGRLGWWQRRRLRFHIVESSPALQEVQRRRLGSRATWWTRLGEALAACEGAALIYSNELIDAFPCAVVQWDAEARQWRELWLEGDTAGAVREVLRPLDWPESELRHYAALQSWPDLHDRQRAEIHRSARDWLASWASAWRDGAMLVIDYGDDFPALYHRRPAGTLRAYLMHQRLAGVEVWQNPGRQDITADVNFTDLRRWCVEQRWREMFYGSQASFLERWAPLRGSAGGVEDRLSLGADEAFRCLVVEAPRGSA